MSKRSNQRARGKRKEFLALVRNRPPVAPRSMQEILADIMPEGPPVEWHNPMRCPLCGSQQRYAYHICDTCQEQAYWLGEFVFQVLRVPWTMNDWGILPSWVRAAIQEGGVR